jgi:hypothetical protein
VALCYPPVALAYRLRPVIPAADGSTQPVWASPSKEFLHKLVHVFCPSLMR